MHALADELLRDSIDLHAHGYPETALEIRQRFDDREWARGALDARMAGFVVKSHLWPSCYAAYWLQRDFPDLAIFGSITLNPSCGGFSTYAIESAALQGAKVVWFPTWGAYNDVSRDGVVQFMRQFVPSFANFTPAQGLACLDADGSLLPEVKEAIAVIAHYGLVLCTGHISPREAIAVTQEAHAKGVEHVIFTHPHSPSTGANADDIQEMVRLGAYIEFAFLETLPYLQRYHPRVFAETVDSVGANRCVMTTDTYFQSSAPPPEMMRMFIATMLDIGVSPDDIEVMVKANPRRILGLSDPIPELVTNGPAFATD